MKRILIVMCMLILSLQANAGGWTEPLTVERAFTEANTDIIVIYTSGGVENTPGCAANSWIFLADSEDRRNRGYSTAMAGLVSGKKVSFWYGDTCAAWGYHGATTIQLHKQEGDTLSIVV